MKLGRNIKELVPVERIESKICLVRGLESGGGTAEVIDIETWDEVY